MKKQPQITLVDGTIIHEGDKVRTQGQFGGRPRVAKLIEIFSGGGVAKGLVTMPFPFGTVIRTRYQIKPYRKATR